MYQSLVTALLCGCSTTKDSVKNVLYERALRITYGDKTFSINELLEKNNSLSIHHKSSQALASEMTMTSNNMSSTTLNDIFAPTATPYNLRNPGSFKMEKLHLAYQGTETLSHLGLKI